MTLSYTRLIAAALPAAFALGGAACRSAPRGTMETAPHTATAPSGDLAAIAEARADSAERPYTEADVHFMSAMIGHHAQAIVMAGWAPTHGASASVRTLAERVVNGQQDEIAVMQQWLRDRLKPVPEVTPTGVRMEMNGVEHEMHMPGMLSEAQMKALDQARGAEFDRLFLTLMIQHHRGAVSMVKQLFDTYGAGQDHTVFKLASDVNVDQTTEIARMERMLFMLELEKGSQ